MNSQWIGIALSVLVMLGGTAVNLFIIGRFVGQWSEAMRNISTTLQKVEGQVAAVGAQGDETEGRVSLIDARLANTEAAAGKFWEMRDEFTAMRVTVEMTGKQQQQKLDILARGMSVIERQLGNLVTSKAGFTTLTSDDTNR